MNRNLFAGSATILDLFPVEELSTTTTSDATDLGNYDGNIALIFSAADPTGDPDNTVTFTLTESETSGGTFTAVTGISEAFNVAGQTRVVLNSDERKRFIKVVATIAGSTPEIIASCVGVAIPRVA